MEALAPLFPAFKRQSDRKALSAFEVIALERLAKMHKLFYSRAKASKRAMNLTT